MPETIDLTLNQVRSKIAEHGWAFVAVYPTDADPPSAVPFAYTVGLTEAGLPELFVNGLPYAAANGVLRQAARAAFAHDTALPDGHRIPAEENELLVDLRVATCTTAAHLGIARALYSTKRVTCLQILWPDRHGAWPDDASFRGHQPIGPSPD